METKLADKTDILDELDHIHATLTYMNYATMVVHEQESPLGEGLIFGQSLIFDWIESRIKAVEQAVENILTEGGV